MKFKKLVVSNFLAIGNLELDLDDQGLILILGENADETSATSNGSGKSTALSSIVWCLYGKSDRGLTGDSVVNRTVGKDCQVSLEVQDGQSLYRVTRNRKHSEYKSRLILEQINGDDVVDLTKGTDSLTQQAIVSILGCSYEVFIKAVYAGQELFPDLPAMTDKELKVLLEEASGIQLLTKAYELARERYRDAERDYDMADQKLDQAQRDAMRHEEDIKRLEIEHARFEKEREESVKRLAQEITTHESELGAFADVSDQLAKVEEGLRRLNDVYTAYNDKKEEHEKSLNVLAIEQRKFDQLVFNSNQKKSELKKLQLELKSIGEIVGQPCSSCGKPYTQDDLSQKADILNGQIEEKKGECFSSAQIVKEQLSVVDDAKQVAEKLEKGIPSIEKTAQKIEQLNQLKQKYTDQQYQKKLVEQKIEQAKAKKQEVDAAANPHQSMSEQMQQRKQELQQAIRQATDAKNDTVKRLEIARDASQVFAPSGIRAEILDTMTPYLNERTAEYLSTLSDGTMSAIWQTLTQNKSGKVSERFSIDVTTELGGETYKSISGGEKRKVKLATALALSDLVATRAMKPIDLFIGDEIDDAIDESGLQRLMVVLNQKAQERGSVFVISHNNLASYITNSITIRKENGISHKV